MQIRANDNSMLGAACALGVAALVAPEIAPGAAWPAWVYDAATLATAVAAYAGARRLPAEARKPWLLISAAIGCFFLGDVIWDIYEQVWHIETSLPSAADVAYLAAYPLLLGAGLSLIGQHTTFGRVNSLLDTTVLAAALSLVVWEPLLLDAGRTVAGALVAGAYPVGDIAFFGLAALLVGGTRGGRTVWLLLTGSAVLLAADLTFLQLESENNFMTGSWADRLFVVARLIIAAAVCSAAGERLEHSPPSLERGRRTLILTMVVVGVLVAIPIDFGFATSGDLRRNEVPVRVGLRLLLLAAVGVRLLRQAAHNEQLLRELQQSSTRLETVVHNTADAVVFADAAGQILEWNPAAEELFDLRRDEIIGTNALAQFLPGDTATRVRETLRGGGDGIRELTLPLLLRGRLVPVNIQVASVRDDADRPVGYVAVARDDTTRTFADHARQTFAHLEPDHALTRFAEELNTFLPFDVLSLTSIDGDDYRELARLTRRNRRGEEPRFEPRAPAELLEGSVSALNIADDGTPYTLLRRDDLVARGARIDDTAVTSFIGLRLREPVSKEIRGYLTLGFRDPTGATAEHADALAAVGPDISQAVQNMLLFEQQRLAADRLRELHDLRDGFLAMVAHDLHGPLSSIGSAASVLQSHRSRLPDDRVDEMLRGITTTANQLTRLTSDLVDATRAGDDRFPCVKGYVGDLGALVAGAASGVAGERGARVHTSVAGGVVVWADADRVTQIVSNLVSNALKFTDGDVEVCLHRDGDDAVIEVVDHGAGIPESAAGRVFARYARLAQPGHQPKGSGLGLYITHELVAAHGGTIAHRPTAGGGATFEVRLPIFHGERPED